MLIPKDIELLWLFAGMVIGALLATAVDPNGELLGVIGTLGGMFGGAACTHYSSKTM